MGHLIHGKKLSLPCVQKMCEFIINDVLLEGYETSSNKIIDRKDPSKAKINRAN